MNFTLVSNTACTFIDWDGSTENCKTYNSTFRGYTPSSGSWSISRGTITAGDIIGYTFVGWYTITSGTYGTVDSATILITTSRIISYSQISSAGRYGISDRTFVCAKYSKVHGVSLLSCGAKSTIGGGSVESGVYDHYLPDYKGYTYGSSNNYPYGTYLMRTGYDITVSNIEDGYEFIGWYTSNTKSSSIVYDSADDATKLLTTSTSVNDSYLVNNAGYYTRGGTRYYVAYAKFQEKKWTINFNANGGSVSPSSVQAGKIHPATLPLPQRNHYRFVGWYTSASGGTFVGNAGDSYWHEGDITIYAHWISTEVIVTYVPNGGLSSRYFDRVYTGDVFPALPTATWDGETTGRWYTLPTGGAEIHEGATVTQTEDFELYAHWNRTETCTVTFNAGGGTASETQRTVNKGAAIGELPTATWTGHTFNGWFLSSGGGTAITEAYVVDDDLYLYAQWDSDTHTVTFNGNGGTPSQSEKSVAYGSQYGTLPYCDQTGKTFLGWFTSATGGTKVEATTIFNQQSDQTLYAHWSDVDPAIKWYYLVSPT